ncbi:MAG: DUF2071 domain-containing protein [Anaerolineae bacterium]
MTTNLGSPTIDRPWAMQQTWSKLLFAHWPLKSDILRPLIPPGLAVDTFDGQAWVGVVPFLMSSVRFRAAPPIPTAQQFCELNVRTYVCPPGGQPGVWFFSLDAASLLAVMGARAAFHLPYYHAEMRLRNDGKTTHYTSTRRSGQARFEGSYQPDGSVFSSQSGTLEHWLTERYCLYAADRQKQLYRGDIEHIPWPLQRATADIQRNTMAQAAGIDLPDTVPLLHYAERIHVRAWLLQSITKP